MIASMWVGNLMLLIINLPLIGLWVRLLKVPYRLMFPAIVLFCCIGIYSVNNSPTEVIMTAGFGLFGYALFKYGFEPAPMLLAFVLGRLMEEKLRQALVISRGSFWTFVERPLSGGLLLISLLMLFIAILPAIRKSRETVFAEAD
jgi:putative tricarboxylic transport membrane protein